MNKIIVLFCTLLMTTALFAKNDDENLASICDVVFGEKYARIHLTNGSTFVWEPEDFLVSDVKSLEKG